MTVLPANNAASAAGARQEITVLRFFGHRLRWYRGFQCFREGICDAVAWRLADAPRFIGVLIETDFFGHVEAAVFETFFAGQQVLGPLFLTACRYCSVWLAHGLFLIAHDNLHLGLICANYVAATGGRAHVNTDCRTLRGRGMGRRWSRVT